MAASVSAELGFLFCIIATVSGSIFAKATWGGSYWNWDPRETSIFVLLLIYGAYFVSGHLWTSQRGVALLSAV